MGLQTSGLRERPRGTGKNWTRLPTLCHLAFFSMGLAGDRVELGWGGKREGEGGVLCFSFLRDA